MKARNFAIVRKVEPSFSKPQDFSISVYFVEPESREKVEVVGIDNAHGYVHMHRFSEKDEEVEEKPSLDAFSAYDYLKDNWKFFAREYFS